MCIVIIIVVVSNYEAQTVCGWGGCCSGEEAQCVGGRGATVVRMHRQYMGERGAVVVRCCTDEREAQWDRCYCG